MNEIFSEFLKRQIVVDTRSPLIYIGTLERVLPGCIVLAEVDVFDSSETTTPKERYIMDSKTSGVKANRDRVYLDTEWIISFSPLDDIKEFRDS